MLIDSSGNKHGIIAITEALNKAKAENLDLVQVSPDNSNPVVCKILNYGKYIFNKKKNNSATKVKTKKQSLKEIKFRPSTDIGDYKIKLKKIKSFILDGNKTKISVRFRGREILNSNLGLDLLNRIKEDLIEISQVDQEPSLEGRQLLMILSPIKKK
jgi:translation initiation factor IF-3